MPGERGCLGRDHRDDKDGNNGRVREGFFAKRIHPVVQGTRCTWGSGCDGRMEECRGGVWIILGKYE